MGMPDVVRRWTREEVLALPDDGNRYELIDGELLVSPSPRRVHQLALTALFRRLDPFLTRHRLGTILMAPADLDFGRGYVVQPDLFVIPEIDLPGHMQAAIAAYPWLGNDGKPCEVLPHWGVNPHILNAEERTLRFCEDVLSEVLELFPSPWIHVGGDEAVKQEWTASPRIQERIRELGAQDEHGLQSHIITRMDTFLTARGRRLIGWDEILDGGLAPNATVMSWRGFAGGIAAARQGHPVVMTPTSHTYFDYPQREDATPDQLAAGGVFV